MCIYIHFCRYICIDNIHTVVVHKGFQRSGLGPLREPPNVLRLRPSLQLAAASGQRELTVQRKVMMQCRLSSTL